MRRRSQSNPNPRRPRPPYKYSRLPSDRHIRLIRIVHYDETRGQLYITLTAYPVEAITNKFTALSYTWDKPVEPFELERYSPDRTKVSADPSTPHPDTIEIIILPRESFQTFRRRDDLAPKDNAMVDEYTPPDIAHLTLPRRSNLSDFFRAYLDGYPDRHMKFSYGPTGVRPRYTFDQVSHLWVDAICIDQSNSTQEKATQIPLMGEIYSRAGRVLAWLGGDLTRVESFCWLHQVAFPALYRYAGVPGQPWASTPGAHKVLRESNPTDPRFWKETVGLEEQPPTKHGNWLTAWMDYWAFYRTRRYFHRAWIVQEVVLSNRFDLMVGRQGRELTWAHMVSFAYFIGHAGWIEILDTMATRYLPKEYTDSIVKGFGVTDIGGLYSNHQKRYPDGEGWQRHWWATLSAVRRRGCFLEQDKVFATIGVLQQALPTGTPIPVPVDASARPEEVFLNAATTLLLHDPKLTLLSFVDHPHFRKLTSLPSWVPDLSASRYAAPIGDFETFFEACILTPSSTQSVPRSITPDGILRLRGFKLDTIETITPYYAPMTIELPEAILSYMAAMPILYRHKNLSNTLGPNPDPSINEVGQYRGAVMLNILTAAMYTNHIRDRQGEMGKLYTGCRLTMHLAFGQLYTDCALGKNGGESGPLGDRIRAIEALIESIIAQEGPDGPTVAIIPSIEELRNHGERCARATRKDGPWPECVVRTGNQLRDEMRRIMLHRCLFATKGGYTGFCLETCRVGDEVWLLEQGPVPYILRPVQGSVSDNQPPKYRFCGECYVHGVMEGELVKGKEAEIEKQFTEVALI
jgi:hypothetical protein